MPRTNERIQLLEYLLAAVRIPLTSGDSKTRRIAAEYERAFALELRKHKTPTNGGKNGRKPPAKTRAPRI